MKRSKSLSLIIIALVYIIVAVGCYFLYGVFDNLLPDKMNDRLLIMMIILDLISTIFVFIMSTIFINSSIYDPYWSVVPILMIVFFAYKVGNLTNGFVVMLISVILVWGLRLTVNWIYTFKNLHYQDWRYQSLKDKHPKLWPLINLFGIHLIPTIVVFIGMLPAFKFVLEIDRNAVPTISTYLGVIIALLAVIIETVADVQMHMFKKISSNALLVCDKGLWKNSRHPNYFGEILFWIGIWMIGTSFYKDPNWILIFSPIIVFLLFVAVSIPMMEKRQLENKPAYKEYMENTNMLLPIFPKTKKNK